MDGCKNTTLAANTPERVGPLTHLSIREVVRLPPIHPARLAAVLCCCLDVACPCHKHLPLHAHRHMHEHTKISLLGSHTAGSRILERPSLLGACHHQCLHSYAGAY